VLGPLSYGVVSQVSAVTWYRSGGAPAPDAVYQPIGAASLAASYLRIAGSGGNANLDPAVVGSGVAPTWASGTGWTLNGSTQWLASGITPGPDSVAVVRFSGGVTGSRAPFGSNGTSNARFLILPAISGSRFYQHGGSASTSGAIATGTMGLTSTAGYLNGALDISYSAVWGSGPIPVAIGGNNNGGTVGNFWSGNIQAIAFYPTSTGHATWVPAVLTAMAAL
jgi:hypothetical protein